MIFRKESEKLKKILKRGEIFEDKYLPATLEILNNVKKYGDKALKEYTRKFDNFDLDKKFFYENSELKQFYDKIPENLKIAFNKAKENIFEFHKQQLDKTFLVDKGDIILGQKITPIENVGIYVPGGKASYPSTVLMNAIPAKVAGVKNIVMVTPAREGILNEFVLGIAYLAGVSRVYLIGGAQAVGALAYGTETVPKVDKIVGPGNIYVALAKKLVFGIVDIDMIAGPSEILIIADKSANPAFVAADMLSQAEHDELASAIAITNDKNVAKEIEKELLRQMDKLDRKDIAKKSIEEYGGILLVDTIDEAVNIANDIAPEHLEISVENPFDYLFKIKNAGAIFLGHFTPEALGDYFAGPNHTLPTGGSAKFFSPLGTYDFFKRSSIISANQSYIKNYGKMIEDMAASEGLGAHRFSVEIRNSE